MLVGMDKLCLSVPVVERRGSSLYRKSYHVPNLMFRNFKVLGRSQLLLAIGISTPLNIANRRQETAPTSVCFKSPKA